MALEIDIKANDDFEKSALKISAALDKIAKDEAKIDALSKKLGVSNKQIAAGQKIAAADQAAETKGIAEAGAAKAKGEEEFRDKLKAGAAGLYLMKDAAIAAYDATVKLAIGIGEAAFEADRAQRGSAALVKAFSGDAGDSVIKQLDEQAEALGESVIDVRQQFVKYREAGASNQVSDEIIKARADMIALGLSAKEADDRLAPVLAAGHDRRLAEAQLHFIAQAEGLKGVGQGAIAAKYALTSVSAAQNKINNEVDKNLAIFWKKIGPSIGAAANELANFVTHALESEQGKAAMQKIADVIDDIANAVPAALKAVTGFYDFIVDNSAGVAAALGVVGIAMAFAFGPAIIAGAIAAATFLAIPALIAVTAIAVGAAVSQIVKHWDELGEALNGAVDSVVDFGEEIFDVVSDIAKSMIAAGANIVDGLVKGVTGAIGGAIDAVENLAGDISGAFKSALGINSPSKVFADFGAGTVEGYKQGQERELGNDPLPLQQVAKERPAVPVAPQASQAQASGVGGGITIENLVVHGGGKPEEVARSIRQELQLLLRAGNLSRGQAA